jgi:hypothetical protein
MNSPTWSRNGQCFYFDSYQTRDAAIFRVAPRGIFDVQFPMDGCGAGQLWPQETAQGW